MAARYQILNAKIPTAAITAFQNLARAPQLEPLVAPRMAHAFEDWLRNVAQMAALQWPTRSGQSANELYSSARVVGGSQKLSTIRGYLLVSGKIVSNEYGATIVPKNAQVLCIPLRAACRPDGSPKRQGPRSWMPLKTFFFKSKKTGKLYIVYKPKNGKGNFVFLYLCVDKTEVPEKKIIRKTYDDYLPLLFGAFQQILTEEIQNVYSKAYTEAYAAFNNGKVLPGRASNMPLGAMHGKRMLPQYQPRF